MFGSPLHGRDRSPDPQLLELSELTPVHQRSSRRLQVDPPEFGPLPATTTMQAMSTPDTATMTSPTTSSDLVVYPPRPYLVFHDRLLRVDRWPAVERVSAHLGLYMLLCRGGIPFCFNALSSSVPPKRSHSRLTSTSAFPQPTARLEQHSERPCHCPSSRRSLALVTHLFNSSPGCKDSCSTTSV
ncbi:hypothetical protein HPB50_007230 [Hyalomma asiaticum]|uniref:Uncharacterized protein n=1 Tax=Hyalomma asiaticum TaxID=266040 RepID=A0ACB7SVT3_HYAAI|nr:hypothetical protein HPB50_007230 [Hyalomma asiaticum]